jgi:predicted Zn-dependent protease
VKFFEKINTDKHDKKGLIAKAFSTHPMTSERIRRAQREIAEYLPTRDDYVVDTSEFQEIRARVAEISDRRNIDMGRVTPVLRKRGAEGPHQDGGGPVLKRK